MAFEVTTTEIAIRIDNKVSPYMLNRKYDEEAICRICMEGENIKSSFITPCKCSGSVRFVHESCLKTWILSQDSNANSIHCELCKSKFLLEFEFTKACSCSLIIKFIKLHLLLFSIVISILASLILLIALIASEFIILGSTETSKMYSMGLMIFCAIVLIFVFLIMIFWVKSICCRKRLRNWKILSVNPECNNSKIDKNDFEIKEKSIVSNNSIENIVSEYDISNSISYISQNDINDEDNKSIENFSFNIIPQASQLQHTMEIHRRAYSDPLSTKKYSIELK